VIDQRNREILVLHNVTKIVERTVTNLETQLAEKDVQIAALHAQLQTPPPGDDTDDDAMNDDGDECGVNAVEEKEEGPEDVIYAISGDEEDTTANKEYSKPEAQEDERPRVHRALGPAQHCCTVLGYLRLSYS
jgi:hypothetical protein